MTKYNANSMTDRMTLASDLIARLEAAGFTRLPSARNGEIVYGFKASDEIGIKVYTSAEMRRIGAGMTPVARAEGADAIRACAVNLVTGAGYIKTTRVNRTGEIDAIVDRAIARARKVWTEARKRVQAEGRASLGSRAGMAA